MSEIEVYAFGLKNIIKKRHPINNQAIEIKMRNLINKPS